MWLIKKGKVHSEAKVSPEMPQRSRHVAGLIVQGDALHVRCSDADEMCRRAQAQRDAGQPGKINDLRKTVWSYQTHNNAVLGEHGVPLPFIDRR